MILFLFIIVGMCNFLIEKIWKFNKSPKKVSKQIQMKRVLFDLKVRTLSLVILRKKIKALIGQNIDQKERQVNFVLFGLELSFPCKKNNTFRRKRVINCNKQSFLWRSRSSNAFDQQEMEFKTQTLIPLKHTFLNEHPYRLGIWL